MTAEEVAAILDISVNTLKGQYKRVRAKFIFNFKEEE